MKGNAIAFPTRFATIIVGRARVRTRKSFLSQKLIDGIQWIRMKGAILPFGDAARAPIASTIHKREEQEREKIEKAHRMECLLFGELGSAEQNLNERIGVGMINPPQHGGGERFPWGLWRAGNFKDEQRRRERAGQARRSQITNALAEHHKISARGMPPYVNESGGVLSSLANRFLSIAFS